MWNSIQKQSNSCDRQSHHLLHCKYGWVVHMASSCYTATCIHIYMPTLSEQLQVYEAPQLTLHMNMSVTLRLLANIKEWTYSMLYIIHWTLVLRGFIEWTRRLTPTPAYCPSPYDQNQEPKERVHSHLWMLEMFSPYLCQLSACPQTSFHCTNRTITSFLWVQIN